MNKFNQHVINLFVDVRNVRMLADALAGAPGADPRRVYGNVGPWVNNFRQTIEREFLYSADILDEPNPEHRVRCLNARFLREHAGPLGRAGGVPSGAGGVFVFDDGSGVTARGVSMVRREGAPPSCLPSVRTGQTMARPGGDIRDADLNPVRGEFNSKIKGGPMAPSVTAAPGHFSRGTFRDPSVHVTVKYTSPGRATTSADLLLESWRSPASLVSLRDDPAGTVLADRKGPPGGAPVDHASTLSARTFASTRALERAAPYTSDESREGFHDGRLTPASFRATVHADHVAGPAPSQQNKHAYLAPRLADTSSLFQFSDRASVAGAQHWDAPVATMHGGGARAVVAEAAEPADVPIHEALFYEGNRALNGPGKLWEDGDGFVDAKGGADSAAVRRLMERPVARTAYARGRNNIVNDGTPCADCILCQRGEFHVDHAFAQITAGQRSIHRRNYDRDADEGVGGFERDGMLRGHDMGSLHCRIANRQ